MKKAIIKTIVLLIIFIGSLFLVNRIMNQGNENLTMEMGEATLPVITMLADASVNPAVSQSEGQQEENAEIGMTLYSDRIAYNQLFGYRKPQDPGLMHGTVTELGSNREVHFLVDTFGVQVNDVSVEVRSRDGKRLIESSKVSSLSVLDSTQKEALGNQDKVLDCGLSLKDLILPDQEYMLVILLDTEETGILRYYTRIILSQNTNAMSKLSFALEFHQLLFDKDAAKAKNVTRYLESSSEGDNSTFHKVNINSSFTSVTWGDLDVTQVTEPVVMLTDVGSQMGTVTLDYMVSVTVDEKVSFYRVKEAIQVRFLQGAARMYLMGYERTMTQFFSPKADVYSDDKILLGITGEEISLMESEDGNIMVFRIADRLCCYDYNTDKVTVLFCFYDEKNQDARALHSEHGMKVLDVDEGGNVNFAVYGYMNRGRHEGEVGILVYRFDNALNTVEEMAYIPLDKSYDILTAEMEQLLYLNRDGKLYLMLESAVYCVDLTNRTWEEMVAVTDTVSIHTSPNHKVIAWQEGFASEYGTQLCVANLGNDTRSYIRAEAGQVIRLLGFMGEDVIYGLVREEDIIADASGIPFTPIYKICICDASGELLKESGTEGIYVTSCEILDDQIALNRVVRSDDGTFRETEPDYIMINEEEKREKNQLAVVVTENFRKYVQIKTPIVIGGRKLQVRSPKEVVFEGGREIALMPESKVDLYYVQDAYGVSKITCSAAEAIKIANEKYGTVTDGAGRYIWRKGNLVTRNQIMAIKEAQVEEGKTSLAVCLDAMLKKEGISINTQALLDQGQTTWQILENEMDNVKPLDLTGVPAETVLYYINQDIPVMATLSNGESVLITGFNEFNMVIMDPVSGELYKKGKNDSAEWFEENGNRFMTYVYTE